MSDGQVCEFTAATHTEFMIAIENAAPGDVIDVSGNWHVIPDGLPISFLSSGSWIKTATEADL